MDKVIVGKTALGDLISLARRAAFDLRATDAVLADALTGAAAETELETWEYAHERVPC